ncbi:MAG: hypothetical protein NMNS01_22860 [Nitrosomonas sp.]|nr:MAG: hypothetical protein NMNS01_22860 [Nitrosomonas sp.]
MNQGHDNRSLTTLVSDLTQQSSDLIRKEAELAKAEMSEKLSEAQSALIALAIGGALLIVGLFYILNAVVYGIAEVLPPDLSPWLAALIVGSTITVIGYFLVQRSKSRLQPRNLKPDQTMDSLQHDTIMLKEKAQ